MKDISLEGQSQLNLKIKDLKPFVHWVSREYQFLEDISSGLEQIPSSLNRIIQFCSQIFSFLINYSAVVDHSKFGLWFHLTRHRGFRAFLSGTWLGASFLLGWDFLWAADCLISVIIFVVGSHKVPLFCPPHGCWAGWWWDLPALGIQVVLDECIWLWIYMCMHVLSMGWKTLICWIQLKRKGLVFVLPSVNQIVRERAIGIYHTKTPLHSNHNRSRGKINVPLI